MAKNEIEVLSFLGGSKTGRSCSVSFHVLNSEKSVVSDQEFNVIILPTKDDLKL